VRRGYVQERNGCGRERKKEREEEKLGASGKRQIEEKLGGAL